MTLYTKNLCLPIQEISKKDIFKKNHSPFGNIAKKLMGNDIIVKSTCKPNTS